MVKSETTTMEKRVKSQALEKFVHNKRAVFGVIVVLVIALCCLLLPLVMDLDPYTTDELAGFNSAPSAEHILGTDDVGRDLFARLSALRKQIARTRGIPPYVVFTDAALRGMADRQPSNKDEMSQISGVGVVKLRDMNTRQERIAPMAEVAEAIHEMLCR